MDYCKTKHACADGKQGECRQPQEHPGKHLCSRCLNFFTGESSGRSEPVGRAPSGVQALYGAAQQFGASPGDGAVDGRGIRQPSPAEGGQFQIFGVWKSAVNTVYGTMYTELVLQPNKKFSQTAVLNRLRTWDTGTVELGDGYIHFLVQDHEPKLYNGQPMSWVKSFTYFYTVVDANTIACEDRVVNTRWTMHRAQ